MKFTGTDTYVATEDLMVAVNAAIRLERPLLVKGEPGTGKTMLAEEISRALKRDLLRWHIKSTTKAQQGLYEYDAVARLRDGQLGEERAREISNYISRGMLWDAFERDIAPVLLIDEIDKAVIAIERSLDESERLVSGTGTIAPMIAFVSSFAIIFREGLESVLILGAIITYLEASRNIKFKKYVHYGIVLAIGATAVTWFIASYVIEISGVNRELIEAVAALSAYQNVLKQQVKS